MKSILKYSVLAAALIGSGIACASDLVIPEPDAVYSPESEGRFYVGATAGGQRVSASSTFGQITGDGLLGGVFAGYAVDFGGVVVGMEADLELSNFDKTTSCANVAWNCNASMSSLGSVRARLGYAVESLLFYGTAGVALADLKGSTSSAGNTFPAQQFRAGWTVGVGAEYAFDENWFGRVEYRYSDYGARDVQFDVVYPDVKVTSQAVRVGVGYKF